MILSYADHDPHAAATEAVRDLYEPAPPARRWRALPGDLDTVATLRWLIGHGIDHDYRTCEYGELHMVALLSDEAFEALLRDVPPAPTGVGR